MVGRTPERARELAEAFGIRPLSLEELPQAERVLISVQPRDFPTWPRRWPIRG